MKKLITILLLFCGINVYAQIAYYDIDSAGRWVRSKAINMNKVVRGIDINDYIDTISFFDNQQKFIDSFSSEQHLKKGNVIIIHDTSTYNTYKNRYACCPDFYIPKKKKIKRN